MKPTSRTYKRIYGNPFVDLRITRVPSKDVVYVTFIGNIYKRKYNRMSFSYRASQFNDIQIINDRDLKKRYIDAYS